MQNPEIKLNGWTTIARLAERIGKKSQYVSLNINYGKIPTFKIPELNNLTLVPGDAVEVKGRGKAKEFIFKYSEKK